MSSARGAQKNPQDALKPFPSRGSSSAAAPRRPGPLPEGDGLFSVCCAEGRAKGPNKS